VSSASQQVRNVLFEHFSLAEGHILASLCESIGITRLARLTGLDKCNMSVWSAIRPTSMSWQTSSGKGITESQAIISSIFESAETAHAEQYLRGTLVIPPISFEPKSDLRHEIVIESQKYGAEVDASAFQDSFKLGVSSIEIKSNSPAIVPLHWAYQCSESVRFGFSTNGLSGGFTKMSALIHSLEEILERHLFSTLLAEGRLLKGSMRRVTFDNVDPQFALILNDLDEGQLLPVFMTSPHSTIPFVWCALFDIDPIAPFLQLTSGFSCGTSYRDAVIRSLTEACQVRCSQIQGTREDFKDPPPSTDPIVVQRIRTFAHSLAKYELNCNDAPIDAEAYYEKILNNLPGKVYQIELQSIVRECCFCKVVAPGCAFNPTLF